MIDIQRRNKAIRKCFYEQLGKGMPVDDEAMGYRIWDALRAIGYWTPRAEALAIGYGTPCGLLAIGR